MMRQMLVSAVAVGVLVGGAPASAGAQGAGASPVQVETLEIEPTVVKTGDVITQVYRVRFPDLIAQGREIIILEDRMVPENLPIHPFEAVSLEIRQAADRQRAHLGLRLRPAAHRAGEGGLRRAVVRLLLPGA